MTTDQTVAKAVEDARLEAEMQELLANRPTYTQALPGTNAEIESGSARALTSTAAELTIWNRETGEPSTVIFDALKARLMQRFPIDHPNPAFRGQKVYTMNQGDAPTPVRGNLACPLSMGSDRSEAIALGFGHEVCPKPAYFKTVVDVDTHVAKSHKRFSQVRERVKAERREQVAIDQQAALAEALKALAGGQAPKAETVSEDLPCDECDFIAKNQFGLQAHKRGKHGGG